MRPARAVAALAAAIALAAPSSVAAQGVDGYLSLMVAVFPEVQLNSGARRAVSELRGRVFVEREFMVGDRVRFVASGFADGLVARRGQPSTTTAGVIRPQEVHVEASWDKADLRVGFSRVVWGRLDEFQPTDVVNPLDFARFFLEGRAEGRIPVGLIRGRVLPSDRFTIEAVYVPVFRRGRFDQLDDDTSPFNVALPPVRSDPPPRALSSAQGGVRVSVTTGRVDWALSAYRGFETVPVYEPVDHVPLPGAPGIVERFPRYTMVGGDFETVRGEWGLRGEASARANAVEAGIGVDRKTGAYRIAGTILGTRDVAGEDADRGDVSLVAAIDRSFARETRSVRVFAVYNPGDESAFARVITSLNLRDNLTMELSGGWFTGNGVDPLSRLATRDFAYARVKVFF